MELLYATLLQSESVVNQVMQQFNLQPWDWLACSAGVLSLFVAIATAYSQFRTEGNTKKMSRSMQVARLKGFYRHLYRNMVKIRSMELLVQREYNNGQYRVPSAEHLLKLKLAEDDICEEAFYSDTAIFEALKELKLQVRNVNIEVDIADRYLSSPHASRKARQEILKTLWMKQGFIASQIETVLTEKFGVSGISNHAKDVIISSHLNNVEKNKNCVHGKLNSGEKVYEKESKMADLFAAATCHKEITDFYAILKEDIEIELGKNDDEEPKIALV